MEKKINPVEIQAGKIVRFVAAVMITVIVLTAIMVCKYGVPHLM